MLILLGVIAILTTERGKYILLRLSNVVKESGHLKDENVEEEEDKFSGGDYSGGFA
jgi:hypothetical protein